MIQRFSPNYKWTTLLKVFQFARLSAVYLLEEEFKKRTGHHEAIAFLYGRSGLYYLLKCINKPGAEVILPSDTCVVVAHSIVLAGYKPVFLDNAINSRQPSCDQYLAAINENTVMVIPTHLYGIPQETKELFFQIKSLRPDIFVLQDCAHSFFCKDFNGVPVTQYGDGALFGMNISKLVNSVKGGILTLNDKQTALKVRELIKNGKINSSIRSRLYVAAAAIAFTYPFSKILYLLRTKTNLLSSQTNYYDDSVIDLPIDFDGRLDHFSAEVGLISLAQYDNRVAHRQILARIYTEVLSSIRSQDIIWFPPVISGATWSHYPVLVVPEKRSSIISKLETELNCEIGVIVDYSIADLKAYQMRGHSSCINAKTEASQIINLPLTWFEPNLGSTMALDKIKDIIRKSLISVFEAKDI